MFRLQTALLAFALSAPLSGCSGDDEGPPPAPKPKPEPTEPTGETGTEPTGETGTVSTAETAEPVVFDCLAAPTTPIDHLELDSSRGYHGLAISPEGEMIGSDGNHLLKVTYDNQVTVFVPNLGQVQGMDWLPDGDLVVASDAYAALVRITPEGSVTPLATDILAYGVVTGPDGMVYAANRDDVFRIDPSTGTKTMYVNGQNGMAAQSVNFSPDFTKFYMTSNFGYALWEMDIDKNLEPTSTPRRLADFGSGYRDALGVDWCGNMYVPDFNAGRLFRITPDGQVSTFVNFQPFTKYGHGLVFGTGVGDWKHDAIYMPQPYDNNTVVEIQIGIPDRSWVFEE